MAVFHTCTMGHWICPFSYVADLGWNSAHPLEALIMKLIILTFDRSNDNIWSRCWLLTDRIKTFGPGFHSWPILCQVSRLFNHWTPTTLRCQRTISSTFSKWGKNIFMSSKTSVLVSSYLTDFCISIILYFLSVLQVLRSHPNLCKTSHPWHWTDSKTGF